MRAEEARALWERGRARWPELALSFDAFVEQAGAQLEALGQVDPAEVCADDLYLVAACLRRLPGAVDRFDAFTWPQVERHLRKKDATPERLAELHQLLLVRLFVPAATGEPPRIAQYTGRGPLLVWLRMTAARALVDQQRKSGRHVDLHTSFANKAADGDVELSFIRGRYEAAFTEALREAASTLTGEQRTLLQLRYREELTSDQIALVLKTSRVTAHRRVASARDALAGQLREKLRARLLLSQTGVEQLMGLFSTTLVPALTAELRRGLA